MKALIAGVALVLGLWAGPTEALWVRLSEEALVAQSDAIVVGRFNGQRLLYMTPAAKRLDLGVIEVRQVLKGNPRTKALYVALPPGEGPAVGTDRRWRPGQTGVWYLRLKGDGVPGVFVADHPQRFQPLDQAAR